MYLFRYKLSIKKTVNSWDRIWAYSSREINNAAQIKELKDFVKLCFFVTFCKIVYINVSTNNKVKIKIKKIV